jgi:hypothetical protein
MSAPLNPILDKIRKIHALAERAGTEAEAANAAARVQELLAKHNLDLGQVLLKEDPGTSMEAGNPFRRTPSHTGILAKICREMFDVLNYFTGSRHFGWRYTFIGLRANVEAAATTFEYLTESVEALVAGAKTRNLLYGNQEFADFRCGAAWRIWEMARQQKAETLAANPVYGELVHIGNALALRMYSALKFRGERGGFGGDSSGTMAFSLGYAEGGRIDPSGARTGRMLK